MGEIDISSAIRGLSNMTNFLRRVVPRLASISLDEMRLLVITLGLYLYCKYFKFGDRRSRGRYTVTSKTMGVVYSGDERLVNIAMLVVVARNRVCHETWCSDTDTMLLSLRDNKDFIELLRYEGIIDAGGNFVEPDGGEYKIAEPVNKDEVDNNNVTINPIEAAINKMKGDD